MNKSWYIKGVYYVSWFFCVLVLVHFASVNIVAAKTTAYKITDGFHAEPPSVTGVGRVLYFINLSIPYESGEIVVSRNPDGTGNANVGDSLQITTLVHNKSFLYSVRDIPGRCLTGLSPLPPTDITHIFKNGNNSLLARFADWCGQPKDISPLYIVHIEDEPQGPEPFLELPWDYESKGLSFTEAASAINSFFDHEYPLLSTNLEEPMNNLNQITTYKSENSTTKKYSSHDGYDYGKAAGVTYGEPVLAAADGIAIYMNSCNACGNAILIDHENGYQTRYYHLQSEGLITNIPGNKIRVTQGQMIGKNGATGNVIPKNEHGAHIHFMVIEDKDKDDDFQNNIPDGITDPYGWQGSDKDPWENYTFMYGGVNKTGNKSWYLWKERFDSMKKELTPEGGNISTERYSFTFPEGATEQTVTVTVEAAPIAFFDNFISIGSTVIVTAKDIAGNFVTNFQKSFEASSLFDAFDISNINPETIAIYSSPDGVTWTKEETIVDLENKKATAKINHLTHFALFAERRDTVPASTIAKLMGLEGKENWFRSDVGVALSAQDNESGLGVAYILYRINNGEWQEYIEPLVFTNEGSYIIEFYSVDKDENVEEVKQIKFTVDKSIPEADMHFDQNLQEIVIVPISTDLVTLTQEALENKKERVSIIDKAGNKLVIRGKDRKKGKQAQFTLETLQYNNDELIMLNEPKLFIKYEKEKKTDSLKLFDQEYLVKGELKIKLDYSVKQGLTKLLQKEGKSEKVKETLTGLRVLHLITEKGTLKYSY